MAYRYFQLRKDKVNSMEDRVPYQEIKNWVLSGLYEDCLYKAHRKGWAYSTIVSNLRDEFCYRGASYKTPLVKGSGSFEYPVEYLMLEVVCLTLLVGSDANQESFIRKEIRKILADNELNCMLDSLPDDERGDFEPDFNELMGRTNKGTNKGK